MSTQEVSLPVASGLGALFAGTGLTLTNPSALRYEIGLSGAAAPGVFTSLTLTPPVAAALAAGNTDDWAPGVAGAARIQATPAGAATVTGLEAGVDGQYLIVTNMSAVDDVTLLAQNAGSVAANRFASNGDTVLGPGQSAAFLYDGVLARWTRVGF